jgi:hypothetical protein
MGQKTTWMIGKNITVFLKKLRQQYFLYWDNIRLDWPWSLCDLSYGLQ